MAGMMGVGAPFLDAAVGFKRCDVGASGLSAHAAANNEASAIDGRNGRRMSRAPQRGWNTRDLPRCHEIAPSQMIGLVGRIETDNSRKIFSKYSRTKPHRVAVKKENCVPSRL